MNCIHRYRFAEPDGPWSKGICRYCGAEQLAHNGHPLDYDKQWYNGQPTGAMQRSAALKRRKAAHMKVMSHGEGRE